MHAVTHVFAAQSSWCAVPLMPAALLSDKSAWSRPLAMRQLSSTKSCSKRSLEET